MTRLFSFDLFYVVLSLYNQETSVPQYFSGAEKNALKRSNDGSYQIKTMIASGIFTHFSWHEKKVSKSCGQASKTQFKWKCLWVVKWWAGLAQMENSFNALHSEYSTENLPITCSPGGKLEGLTGITVTIYISAGDLHRVDSFGV